MRRLLLGLFAMLVPMLAWAQGFGFRAPPSAADPGAPALIRDLAERIVPVYQEPDIDRYLTTVSALQMALGDWRAADDSRRRLRAHRRAAQRPVERAIVFDLFALARAIEARDRVAFAQAYRQAFRELIPEVATRDLPAASDWLLQPASGYLGSLQRVLDRLQGKDSITLDEALELIWAWVTYDAYRSAGALVETLLAEEDRRRYTVDDGVTIQTAAGQRLHALVVRPAGTAAKLPALLEFTLQVSPGEAKAAAAHGYVGVVAYTRGKLEPGEARVLPFQHDGEDARAVIAWIAGQPWSDGRVGMMGSGYAGFAAWAAAKRLPQALKAIATFSPMAPGVDFPMAGNIFRNSAYRWAEANLQRRGPPPRSDDARWRAIDQAWYRSGRRYRDLEHLPGKPERAVRDIVRTWLSHPSFDRYWQNRIPFGAQFAAIDIPVFTATGYYAAGEPGALYYFREHAGHHPAADHTLLIGPYDDRGASPSLRSYAVDPAALIDLRELRYQWFDHVLKGAARPAPLKDRVNYQLMGANVWRHAPSLQAMGNARLRLHLAGGSDGHHRLTETPADAAAFIEQQVDFTDRSDADWTAPAALVHRQLPLRHALVFATEPLRQPLEIVGLPAGVFDFTPNRMDVDLSLTLYEQLPGGAYLQLSEPWEFRASYLRDRTRRQLLQAGVRQQLPFTSERLTARRLQPGSRLVLVLAVIKRPDLEINYGSGKDVSEESIDDGKLPLRIRWHAGSHVELPVHR